jgi:hypothetical protein
MNQLETGEAPEAAHGRSDLQKGVGRGPSTAGGHLGSAARYRQFTARLAPLSRAK